MTTPAPSKSRRFAYDRMTAEQFNAALRQLEMPYTYFARISGANLRKVEEWTKGQEDIPHWVMVLCSLMTLPGGKDLAGRVTDAVVHLHRPPSTDQDNKSLGERLVQAAEEARQIARGDIPAPKQGGDHD